MSEQPAYANAWMGSQAAIYWLNLPFFQAFFTFGLTLLAVVLVEAWILKKQQQIPLFQSLWISLVVNLFSSLIGFVNAALLIGAYLGALAFRTMFRRILKLTDCSEQLQRIRFLSEFRMPPFLFFLLINISSFVAGLILEEFSLRDDQGFIMNSAPLLYTLPLGSFLAVVGFGISLLSEGYLLSFLLPNQAATLTKTVVWMQLGSYGWIVMPMTILQAVIYAGYLPRLGQ